MLNRAYEEDDEEEEESDGWLASYSDLITDLLAVFVLLFSFALLLQGISKTNTSKNIEMLDGGTGVMAEDAGAAENDGDDNDHENNESKTDKLVEELRIQIIGAGIESQVSVSKQGENRIVMRIIDSVLFDPGKATIKSKAIPVLESVIAILGSHESSIQYIHIEGHTDNRPISNAQFPSNWELSTGRAGSVVRYIIEKSGIEPTKFSSAGYGEFHPIADNSTEAGKALNRRVEFSIELNETDQQNS